MSTKKGDETASLCHYCRHTMHHSRRRHRVRASTATFFMPGLSQHSRATTTEGSKTLMFVLRSKPRCLSYGFISDTRGTEVALSFFPFISVVYVALRFGKSLYHISSHQTILPDDNRSLELVPSMVIPLEIWAET